MRKEKDPAALVEQAKRNMVLTHHITPSHHNEAHCMACAVPLTPSSDEQEAGISLHSDEEENGCRETCLP